MKYRMVGIVMAVALMFSGTPVYAKEGDTSQVLVIENTSMNTATTDVTSVNVGGKAVNGTKESANQQANDISDTGKQDVNKPSIIISRDNNVTAIDAGKEATITLNFKNVGSTKVENGVASISTSDGLMLNEASSSFQIVTIGAGETQSICVKLKALDSVSTQAQYISVDMQYQYDANGSTAQGNTSDKVPITANIKQESKSDKKTEQPAILITRNELDGPIKSGESKNCTINVKNIGNTTLQSAVLNLTFSSGIMLTSSTSSFDLSDIKPDKTKSVTITIKGDQEISSSGQTITAELKYGYRSGDDVVQASTQETVNLVADATKDAMQPNLIISRSDMAKPILPNETQDIILTIKNVGTTDVLEPFMNLTPSDGIVLLDGTSTYSIKNLAAGESADIPIKVKGEKEISTYGQSITVEVKYGYQNKGNVQQGTCTERVNMQATPNQGDADVSVPNIIITKFAYGKDAIAAGERFPLEITFKNTSNANAIENIVVTLDSGDSFTMDGESNTYYYTKLAAGQEQTQKINMQALPTAKVGGHQMELAFKYEYLNQSKRTATTSDIKISVPIYQPDRFQVNAPLAPETSYVGEETTLTLNYVNKGKTDVYNVEAKMEGDVESVVPIQNLGNFEAGKSGTIGFAFTPNQAGEVACKLIINYEDENMNVMTKEFPVTLHVQEQELMTDYGMEEDMTQTSSENWVWMLAGIVVILGIGFVMILHQKKKKKQVEEYAFAGVLTCDSSDEECDNQTEENDELCKQDEEDI